MSEPQTYGNAAVFWEASCVQEPGKLLLLGMDDGRGYAFLYKKAVEEELETEVRRKRK